VLKKRK